MFCGVRKKFRSSFRFSNNNYRHRRPQCDSVGGGYYDEGGSVGVALGKRLYHFSGGSNIRNRIPYAKRLNNDLKFPTKEYYVISDIHNNVRRFMQFLRDHNIINSTEDDLDRVNKSNKDNVVLLFLGDVICKDKKNKEFTNKTNILRFIIRNRSWCKLILGNHELYLIQDVWDDIFESLSFEKKNRNYTNVATENIRKSGVSVQILVDLENWFKHKSRHPFRHFQETDNFYRCPQNRKFGRIPSLFSHLDKEGGRMESGEKMYYALFMLLFGEVCVYFENKTTNTSDSSMSDFCVVLTHNILQYDTPNNQQLGWISGVRCKRGRTKHSTMDGLTDDRRQHFNHDNDITDDKSNTSNFQRRIDEPFTKRVYGAVEDYDYTLVNTLNVFGHVYSLTKRCPYPYVAIRGSNLNICIDSSGLDNDMFYVTLKPMRNNNSTSDGQFVTSLSKRTLKYYNSADTITYYEITIPVLWPTHSSR